MKKTKTNIKKVLSIALCLALIMSYVPMVSLDAFAADGIRFIDENGNEYTFPGTGTEVTSSTTAWSNGWYVVRGDVTIASRVTVSGTVNLILSDGASLTVNGGICVNSGNTFVIYAQSTDEATMGKLTVTGGNDQAGIGGNDDANSGAITINGGVINAEGGDDAPGIGGGAAGSGNVVINGGIVYSEPGYYRAAAIGNGIRPSGKTLISTVTITGGTVTAKGYIGAYNEYNVGSRANITITGGNIKANAIYNNLSSGEANGSRGLKKYTFDFGDVEHSRISVDGLPSYYNLDNARPIDGVYYLWLPSDFVQGDAYLDGVKYEHTDGKYIHTCELVNSFCECGNSEAATETNDKYDVDGDGYTDQVYEIANAGQLYWFAKLVNGELKDVQKNERANAVLTDDIVVNRNVLNDDFSLNGDGSNFRKWIMMDSFRGVFDGGGHKISGLYINEFNSENAGFCRSMYGTVKNLAIVDTYFQATSGYYGYAGGIAIYANYNSIIDNCFIEANLSTGGYYAGGFVACGFNGDGKVATIKNSVFVGLANSDSKKHPFIDNGFGTVINCYYDNSLFTKSGVYGIPTTPEKFASGEITYVLNNNLPDGVWKQTLGQDAYPGFTGEKIYYGYSCKTEEYVGYTNEKAHPIKPHYSIDGYCGICKQYQPATLNADGFYEIYNAGQLYWFAEKVNSFNNSEDAVYNAILMNDIVINENLVNEDGNLTENAANLRQWIPISSGVHTFYNGVFNGNYHTISGIYIDDPDLSYSALFGKLQNGVIRNLGITDSYINGERSSAFASLSSGLIENCFVTDTIIKGQYADSFVVGYSDTQDDYDYPCMVKKSYSTAVVYENGIQVQAANLSDRISENAYYLNDTDNEAGGKTAEQFASGEVAYLLGSPWGQELEKDSLPVWNGKTVYLGYDCGGTDEYYSNTELLGENDNNHIHSEWGYSSERGKHERYICTREGCPQYMVVETEDCYGGTATCQSVATCSVCHYYYGDYDYNNHTSTKTYMTQGDENGHQIFHECCDTLVDTVTHTYEGYDFDSTHHWHACECGYVNEKVEEAHTFDVNGFCTVCGGYEPANVIFDEEYYAYVAEIENAGQFFWYAKNYSENTLDGDGDGYGDNVGGVLVADIDLNPGYTFNEDGSYSVDETVENYSPVLREWKPIQGFQWVDFDGQNHTVKGLYINTPDENNVGLFASNDYYTIKNIKLVNGFVYGRDNTAALVGYNGGNIVNCHSDISIKGSGVIGGIAGCHSNGEITGCSNTGSVVIYGASSSTGGIAGTANGGINNCFNTGYIKGGICVGGIAGNNNSLVSNCYNTGIVLSNFSDAHGISGYGSIENCYSMAKEDDGEQRKTKEQFESGEIAYLLQSAQPVNEIYDEETWEVIGTEQPFVWFQTIGTDLAPTLDNASLVVYRNIVGGCCEEIYVYSYENTEKEPVITHSYNSNGFCVCGEYESAAYDEAENEYKIANAGQLYWFAEKVNSEDSGLNATLISDITVNVNVLDENGNLVEDTEELREWNIIESFSGEFDGNGHIISGLYSVTTGVAAFIDVNNGNISKLTVQNSYFESTDKVAGFVNINMGIISNCGNDIVLKADIGTGGIAYVNDNVILNCYYSGEYSAISATAATGPISAHNYNDISNCYYLAEEETDSIDGTNYKSSEQFASGEVAHLLQKGNSEQIWGQSSNQPGATPVIDLAGLYKVATIGDSGSFSVSSVGDANNDGTVDVIDYQALVNEVLSGSNDQIESENYDDIKKYDLDGNGYLNVVDASIMERLINGHVTVEVFAVGDFDRNGISFEEADVIAIKNALKNTQALTTEEKHACDINRDGIADYKDLEEVIAIYG